MPYILGYLPMRRTKQLFVKNKIGMMKERKQEKNNDNFILVVFFRPFSKGFML
jgi:hypothetical protein